MSGKCKWWEPPKIEGGSSSAEKQGVHALFQHNLPTPEKNKKTRGENNCHGKGQPEGSFDLDRFDQEGSYGRHLKEHIDTIGDPLRYGASYQKQDPIDTSKMIKTSLELLRNHPI